MNTLRECIETRHSPLRGSIAD